MLVLRAMTPADTDGKGFVHYQSWQETYAGLVDENYLARMSVEKCRAMAHRYPESTIVAELNGKIVGFPCYGPCRTPGCEGMGEVMAIYILKEAQGLGIGRKLMDAAIEKLSAYDTILIWVLKGNEHAIGFYEHYGFRVDGIEAPIVIGTSNTVLRLTLRR